jgi:hypothetical protein
MPRHLISDAHEWINESPVEPRKIHTSLTGDQYSTHKIFYYLKKCLSYELLRKNTTPNKNTHKGVGKKTGVLTDRRCYSFPRQAEYKER